MLLQALLSSVLVTIALHKGWSALGEPTRGYRVILNTVNECSDAPAGSWEKLILKRRGTKSLIKANLEIREDVTAPMNVKMKMYRITMGARTKVLELETEACKELEKPSSEQHFSVRALFEGSNLPKHCPVPKGTYTFHNVTLDIEFKFKGPFMTGNFIATAAVNSVNSDKALYCLEFNIDIRYS